MKVFLIFLIIGVAFAIKCSEDAHCGVPDIRAKCVDGRCMFTRLRPVDPTGPPSRRSVRSNRRPLRGANLNM
ncbi:hypothetical protein GCK72_009563 [Caenorhabditis remanei]|uniref:Uncharacterized protein n=1 Tax=Caenorhabditis remanei TaxID=31234 RepID=A0A6A5H234_CAERE|nr:hypothetical protein GCK72_009563 [Caenorhabditis remanei]KAF1761307.1 hypothetical protein GCK72_009563 [Caenorhabditis remanei]